MNERRYQELLQKRQGEGLTDEEAKELGRLMAESMGMSYEGAAEEVHAEQEAGEESGKTEAELRELREAQQRERSKAAPRR